MRLARLRCDRHSFDLGLHRRSDAFLAVLAEVERAGTPLFTRFDLVRWNIRKTYLRDLTERGVPVVPTIWRERLASGELPALIEEIGTDEVVIKPVVGLNAHGVFRVNARSARQPSTDLSAHYAEREFMVQPFLSHVISEGEFSLSYFNGKLSHAILKTPKAHDFRVQEEHGGVIQAVQAESELRVAGDNRFARARLRPALRPGRFRPGESWRRLLADGAGTDRAFALPANEC